MTKSRLFLITLVGMIIFGSLSQMTYALYPTTDPWLMWRHDLSRSGVGTSIAPNNNQTTWTWAHYGLTTTPLLVNGLVIVADSNKVYALDETTGVPLWNTTFTIQGSIQGTPVISDGRMFFGTSSGYLYSVNATTGTKIQEYTVNPDTIYTSPAVMNGIVYFGTTQGYLYALDAPTLGYLWRFNTQGGAIHSSPTIHQNWLYFGCDDGKVYALNITGATPSVKWRFSTNGTLNSTPAYANGMIFIGTSSTDHSLIALNATGGGSALGQLIWKYRLLQGYAVDNSPAFARVGSNDLVFFTGKYDQAFALYANALPGIYQENDPSIRKWQVTVGSNPSSPVVADGKVFLSASYNLYALNATTGITKWFYKFATYGPSEPIIADGHVLVTNYAELDSFGPFYPPQTYYFTVTVQSQNFIIKLVIANATPGSQMDISGLVNSHQIGYTLRGITNTIGTSNITIPKALLNATMSSHWIVTIDGASPDTGPTVVANNTHSSLYFTYLQSFHSVVIQGDSSSVPEFPSMIIAPLLVAFTLIAATFAKKKIPKK